MRFYAFGNYYLSSIQQGIQAGHVISEMSIMGKKDYTEWAKNHKTIVLLNGGNSESLQDIYNYFIRLQSMGMKYVYAKFNEDEQSLNKALTSVGIIIPEKIYDSPIKKLSGREKDIYIGKELCEKNLSEWEILLIEKISEFRLAN